MAENRARLGLTDPWVIVGTISGYWAVAKDVPDILKMLGVPRLVPEQIKAKLLQWNASPDFWLLWFFTAIIIALWVSIVLWVRLVARKKEIKEREKEDIIREVSRRFRRKRILGIILSLGLVFVREVLLNFLHVESYGTFQRPPPPDWPLSPDRLKSIDRIGYADGRGIEFQYSGDFSYLIIREHPGDSNQFGDAITRPPSWADVKLLMLASNIFPFWFFIYLLKRPRAWLRKLCRE